MNATPTAQPELTVLSFGGGQDSTAILHRLVLDLEFRRRYAPGRLLVVMSDTGDEHPDTVEHVGAMRRMCQNVGIEFEYLTTDRGYHRGCWSEGLARTYERLGAIGSVAYPKTCSANLKVYPIWRFLEEWIAARYGIENRGKKFAVKEFVRRHGKVRVLLGIAAGEEKRCGRDREPWAQLCVQKVYPLIDLGWDRAACQRYVASIGQAVPPPSNCLMCPFKSKQEVLWTYRRHPERWEQWVSLEAAKVRKHEALGADPRKNYGVKGVRLLPAVLEAAQREFGHLSDEELDAHRMSHGHCNSNAF